MDEHARDTGRSDPQSLTFDEGRFLYCVVETGGDTDVSLSSRGVDGGDPYLIERGGLGVVVQPCTSPYDSTDPDTVKRWLLRHQGVIDEATEAFGTPLPFRFDTILKGTDRRVREWIDEESDALRDALSDLSGNREYRIEVIRDRSALESRLATEDDRLAEIRERRQAASEGTAFLLDKKYEQRLRGLTERRLDEATESLADRLQEVANGVEEVDRTASILDDGAAEDRDEYRSTFAVLAPEEREDTIGAVLDELAARPGIEIRFTGPWPPYSFAPAIGGES